MRRALAAIAIVAAVVAPAASASGGRGVARCSQQSTADFPGAFFDPANLVVGPFAWLGARRGRVDGAYKGRYRWKQPVLVRPGHRITLRIGSGAARFAGLEYAGVGGDWDYRRSVRVMSFHSCANERASSRSSGQPVTFWSGGIVLTRSPACVPVTIRVDRGPVQYRTVAMGEGARCP
jgi:hypothetical protein